MWFDFLFQSFNSYFLVSSFEVTIKLINIKIVCFQIVELVPNMCFVYFFFKMRITSSKEFEMFKDFSGADKKLFELFLGFNFRPATYCTC